MQCLFKNIMLGEAEEMALWVRSLATQAEGHDFGSPYHAKKKKKKWGMATHMHLQFQYYGRLQEASWISNS
jgi:hypothetical protein